MTGGSSGQVVGEAFPLIAREGRQTDFNQFVAGQAVGKVGQQFVGPTCPPYLDQRLEPLAHGPQLSFLLPAQLVHGYIPRAAIGLTHSSAISAFSARSPEN